MNRRRFLTLLGLAPLVPYVPKKAYSFLGGILRPRPEWTINRRTYEMIERQINPPIIASAAEVFFKWDMKIGEPLFRISNVEVRTDENGFVTDWNMTDKSTISGR